MSGSIPEVPEIARMREAVPGTTSETEVDEVVLAGCTIKWFNHWKHLCTAFESCGTTVTRGGNTTLGVSRKDSQEIQSTLKIAALGIGPELASKLSTEYTLSYQTEQNWGFSTPVPACDKCRLDGWQLIERVEITIRVSTFFGSEKTKVKQAVKALSIFDSFKLYEKDPTCPSPECRHESDLPTKAYILRGDGYALIVPGVTVWAGAVVLEGFNGLYKVGDTVPPKLLERYTASLPTWRLERNRGAVLAEYPSETISKRARRRRSSPFSILGYYSLIGGTLLAFLISKYLRKNRNQEVAASSTDDVADQISKSRLEEYIERGRALLQSEQAQAVKISRPTISESRSKSEAERVQDQH
jgi:hypothetical protein